MNFNKLINQVLRENQQSSLPSDNDMAILGIALDVLDKGGDINAHPFTKVLTPPEKESVRLKVDELKGNPGETENLRRALQQYNDKAVSGVLKQGMSSPGGNPTAGGRDVS